MSIFGSQCRVLLHSPPPALSNQTILEPFLCPGNSLYLPGFGGSKGGRNFLYVMALHEPFLCEELQCGNSGIIFQLMVHGNGNGAHWGWLC